jgi:hypothetical protein
MVEKEVEYVSGTSNTGITKRTVFGSILGSKKSSNQLAKWLVAPNKRVYKRKRKVWMCGSCAGRTKSNMTFFGAISTLFQALLGLLILCVAFSVIVAVVGYILGIPL